MVVDYEAAWHRLQALIASKSQHGREPTLVAMSEIAEECRVPAGELSRLLRLYGVEVERARSLSAETADGRDGFGPGASSGLERAVAAHHGAQEVHDGRRRRAGAGAEVG